MTWHYATSWSAETSDGLWYAEREGKVWRLYLRRGRGSGHKGDFRAAELAMAFVESQA